jgi:hypothetical protein
MAPGSRLFQSVTQVAQHLTMTVRLFIINNGMEPWSRPALVILKQKTAGA